MTDTREQSLRASDGFLYFLLIPPQGGKLMFVNTSSGRMHRAKIARALSVGILSIP